MGFNSSTVTVQVAGGETVTGLNRLYGCGIKAGAATSSVTVRETSITGNVLDGVSALATAFNTSRNDMPVSVSGKTLYIEAVGNATNTVLYVDDATGAIVTHPYDKLVTRVTILNYNNTKLLGTVTVTS